MDSVSNEGSLPSSQMGDLLAIKYIHACNACNVLSMCGGIGRGREGERNKLAVWYLFL